MASSAYTDVVDYLRSCPAVLWLALGGSRSRGTHGPMSDYDLFCVVEDASFASFRRTLAPNLESSIPGLLFIVEVYYLEGWGYLFKGLDDQGVYYDLSIIPKSRAREIGIRSTNQVLYDTNGLYAHIVAAARDTEFEPRLLLSSREGDIVKVFCMYLTKFAVEAAKGDYWMMVRYLERLRNGLMARIRCQRGVPPKSTVAPEKEFEDHFRDLDLRAWAPEKEFEDHFRDLDLRACYLIDGTATAVVSSAMRIAEQFAKTLSDTSLLRKALHITDASGVFAGLRL